MVGRVLGADYRRDLNFLSCVGYTAYRVRYTRIQVQPIVASATGQYHSTVTRENKSRLRTKAQKHEYRRDGSGRR
jgi:hypothetical protein